MALFRNLFYWFQRVFRGLRRTIRESAGQAAGDGQTVVGQTVVDPSAASQAGRQGRRGAEGGGTAHLDTGGPAGSTTLRPSSASHSAAYQKAVARLKLELVGRQKSIPESLEELVERWNPLYDTQARTELVEDVNAMIRDYVRSLKRSFRASPPSAARIRDLAAKLSENKAFERIKRRDVFVHYIQVYMLKLMGER